MEDQQLQKGRVLRTPKDKNHPFVMVSKEYSYNSSLSWKAKGILTHLLTRPDDWLFYESELVKHSKDGRDSLRAGIDELIAQGYLKRSRIRSKKGTLGAMEYIVHEFPLKENTQKSEEYTYVSPTSDFPTQVNPTLENPLLLNNNLTKNDNTDIYRAFSETAHTHTLSPNNKIMESKNCANEAIVGEDVVKSMDSDSKDDCCIIYIMENKDLVLPIETQNPSKINNILKKDLDTLSDSQKANNKPKRMASTLHEDWTLSKELKQWAREVSGWTDEAIDSVNQKFTLHYLRINPGKKSCDWDASWQAYFHNAAGYNHQILKTDEQLEQDAKKRELARAAIPPVLIPPELKKEWAIVQGALKKRVGDATFKSWLGDLSPTYPFKENKLTITASNPFTKDRVSQHFYEDMKKLCVKAMGVKDIEFLVRAAP